ncbi:MAG: tRNA ((34)-2-O)-methyltransferase [Hydrocarboniphaga sp.]|uniref:tRNA (cytidine(34)-2'-O)-methyltransferase n=1 Tax=Hydrocarboniphaga sp. TaxID=2033016 RepID=UPI00260758E8|nr:tRNA (cytidine(34)-2'-O)-methyltransferase [Hydrocarboniphaga sp.]MDB5972057.1 tRNA ((34)-2-O)-methyltransferase [Hydrocarboniphaga sp.]
MQVALYQPEIPPNTGNVMRLCANTGSTLHLIKPLGFSIDDAALRRAGMDYRDQAVIRVHESYEAFLVAVAGARIFALSTKAQRRYDSVQFRADDVLLFGPESRGLPAEIRDSLPADHGLRLPMQAGSRSLNLSNAVAAVVYEAWRQAGFAGGA